SRCSASARIRVRSWPSDARPGAAHEPGRVMQLDLTEEQVQIRDAVREVCEREFAPHAMRWDQEGAVPHAAIESLAAQGFLGMAVPEAWGGLGYDARTVTLVIEEIARVSAALAIM